MFHLLCNFFFPAHILSLPCSEDMYAQDSIDMLTAAGIQFKRHEEEGIELEQFAELLMSSGLVLNEDITWITFARCVCVCVCVCVRGRYLQHRIVSDL